MTESIIILDVIIERASSQRILQLCSGLTNTYYSTNATAHNTYTFGWGPFGGLSGDIKLTMGTVGVLVTYNGSTQQVEAIGTCGDGMFESLSILNDTTLQYSNGGFSFSVQFHLVDGAAIEISVKPTSNTTIAAAS